MKKIFSTKSIASVFNHFALHRLHSNVSRTIYVHPDEGLKLHFKLRCPAEIDKKECEILKNNLILDFSLNKLKEKIQQRLKNIF